MPSRVYNSKTKEGSRDRVCAITKYTCQARLVIQPPTQHLITYVTVVTTYSLFCSCLKSSGWSSLGLLGELIGGPSTALFVLLGVPFMGPLVAPLVGLFGAPCGVEQAPDLSPLITPGRGRVSCCYKLLISNRLGSRPVVRSLRGRPQVTTLSGAKMTGPRGAGGAGGNGSDLLSRSKCQ